MDVYRRMTPGQRLELAVEMSMESRAVSSAGIHLRHPDYSDDDVRWALWRMLVGHDLFVAAWPHAPALDP